MEVGATTFLDKVEPHRTSLLRYARRLSGSVADADDLVQEAMARALRGEQAMPEGDQVGPWLMVILYRVFIDQCRRRKAETKAYEGIRHITSGKASARPAPLPKWMTVSDEDVREAVAALPDKLRVPYVLRARGKSYEDIAEQLDMGINTVSTRLRRARLALRTTLEARLDARPGDGESP